MDNSESIPLHHETTNPAEQEEREPQQVKLSPKQMLALPIIAASPNLTQGARDAGISGSTLRRWRRDEHFRAEMDRLTAEIAETTRQGLKDITLQGFAPVYLNAFPQLSQTPGFSVIKELMEDSDPMVRLRAAAETTRQGLKDITIQGFSVIKELMEDSDPMVRLRAARAAVILGIQVCRAEEYRQENQTLRKPAPTEQANQSRQKP